MKITVDPRCPKHPTITVAQRGLRHRAIWICDACRRPLGLASFNYWDGAPFPQGRRPPPDLLRYLKMDILWMCRFEVRHVPAYFDD